LCQNAVTFEMLLEFLVRLAQPFDLLARLPVPLGEDCPAQELKLPLRLAQVALRVGEGVRRLVALGDRVRHGLVAHGLKRGEPIYPVACCLQRGKACEPPRGTSTQHLKPTLRAIALPSQVTLRLHNRLLLPA